MTYIARGHPVFAGDTDDILVDNGGVLEGARQVCYCLSVHAPAHRKYMAGTVSREFLLYSGTLHQISFLGHITNLNLFLNIRRDAYSRRFWGENVQKIVC